MKQLFLISIISLCATSVSWSQNKVAKVLRADQTQIRGYYKSLQLLDPNAQPTQTLLDTSKYGTTAADWERFKNRQPYYLNAKPELVKLSPPPANNSIQTKKELEYLVTLQQQRSDEDVRSSLFFANIWFNVNIKIEDKEYARFQRNLFHIGRSVGVWFNADSLPITRNLIANVWRDANYFIWYYKYKYDRIRPYKLESQLKNLEETNWPAYPSGHAGNSYVAAYLYSALAPEFADIFVKDALDMAHSREIIGVHYPSDSESGRILARNLIDLLMTNSKFKNDFKQAQEEWKIVRGRNL
jgi:acid phosphatase (class A)